LSKYSSSNFFNIIFNNSSFLHFFLNSNPCLLAISFKLINLSFLSLNEYCDMPVLFERLKLSNKRIIAYPMHEPWLDVGRPVDLNHANRKK
jgi:NDP-sugar pyrophosphorylase family protein